MGVTSTWVLWQPRIKTEINSNKYTAMRPKLCRHAMDKTKTDGSKDVRYNIDRFKGKKAASRSQDLTGSHTGFHGIPRPHRTLGTTLSLWDITGSN